MPANPCSSSSSVVDVFFPSPFVVFGDFVVHLLISSEPLRSQREDIFFNPVDCVNPVQKTVLFTTFEPKATLKR